MSALGFLLVFVIPAIFAAAFWALIARLVRVWEGRDVMDRFRPDRRDVADFDRDMDDLHYDVVVGS